MSELSTYANDRPRKSESERHETARRLSAHLPKLGSAVSVSNADLSAMKAAFIKRFDEDLPRTETLMAVAMIGYRMALASLTEANHD